MKFCIATVAYWQSHGFDTAGWRKSTDGIKALVHLGYALTLIPNLDIDIFNVTTYDYPSEEFEALLASTEWTSSGEGGI